MSPDIIIMSSLAVWFWLLGSLICLLILERWIQRHLQGMFLLLVGDADLALVIYSVLMLPGVLLHEGSHWLAATLLFVRAGRFSVIPQHTTGGNVRLGYVETEAVDIFREALIGAAPLFSGAAVVVGIGYSFLGLEPLTTALMRGDLLAGLTAACGLGGARDLWLWLYLIFAVSNSMLPSPSDRRAWLPVLVIGGVVVGMLFYIGLGSVLVAHLAQLLDWFARGLAAAFTITVGLNLLAVPLIGVVERGISWLTGRRVEYC